VSRMLAALRLLALVGFALAQDAAETGKALWHEKLEAP
jgi:hypothetical protein